MVSARALVTHAASGELSVWRAYHRARAYLRDAACGVVRPRRGVSCVSLVSAILSLSLSFFLSLALSLALFEPLLPALVGVGWWRHRRRHPLISLATPPFFIFSLLKRQMDKVYCKVGSAHGKTAQAERRERTRVGERERAREDADEVRNRMGESERRRALRCR